MTKLQGISVLVVDDESYLRDILRFLLEYEGATVHEAEGGQAALALLQLRPVDVVLSDLTMPAGDGFSLLQDICAMQGPQPKTFLYSGNAHIDKQRARGLGALEIFAKPFNEDCLIAAIFDSMRAITP